MFTSSFIVEVIKDDVVIVRNIQGNPIECLSSVSDIPNWYSQFIDKINKQRQQIDNN